MNCNIRTETVRWTVNITMSHTLTWAQYQCSMSMVNISLDSHVHCSTSLVNINLDSHVHCSRQVQYQSGYHCSRWSQSEKQHSVSCWKWGRIILYNISRELGFKQVAKNTKCLQIHQISLGSTCGGVKVSLYTPPKLGNILRTVCICLAGES